MTPQQTYDSRIVARYLLSLADSKGVRLNTTQTQKLLYIAYGTWLAKFAGHRLLDESPQAWPFGPVFPKTRSISYTETIPLNDSIFKEISSDEYVGDLLNKIIENFGKISAKKLSDWSHMNGSPWERTTRIAGFNWSMQIPDEYIKSYFKPILVNG